MRAEKPIGELFALCSYHRCREKTCGVLAAPSSNRKYCKAHICNGTACYRESCFCSDTHRIDIAVLRASMCAVAGTAWSSGPRR
ncbi:uncharacterized protein PG986_000708 [Apiospora aurea]|uniref:Uncharacterized protein n=1 Tax=Apiospora aurea TaxID=335848 RepID=A0ABR1QUR9_9PEZI